MLFRINALGIILILFSFLCIFFTFYSFKKRKDNVYFNLGLLSFFCFIDFLFQGLECLITSFNIQSILLYISTFAVIFMPSIWLLISYSLVKEGQDLSEKWKILLFLIPIFSAILVVTNPFTHWVYDLAYPTVSTVYKLQLVIIPHFGYKLFIFYNYFCTMITISIIIYGLIKGSKIFRKTYLILFITSILDVCINLLAYTPLYPGFHFGLISYMLTIILLFITVFIYNKFDLLSIVNENVISDVDVGILYFNVNDHLLSANKASSLINVSENDINMSVDDIFRNHEDILNFYYDDSDLIQLEMNEKWVEIKKTLMQEEDTDLGKIFTVSDISNSILELEQKDILVKEVNHRVKNNLQIILSLLNLDIRFHPDNPMTVIDDTRSRLRYMADLHEKLYTSNDNNTVDIKEYLPEISKSLIIMYNSNIQVFEDMDSYLIDLDIAVSLGLILTEVINNTIKYAFKEDNNHNKFFIEFNKTEDCGVIDLFDNGEGLPDGFDFESSTGLGMTVIKSLTSQIDGEVCIIPDDGAHFRIKFPLN